MYPSLKVGVSKNYSPSLCHWPKMFASFALMSASISLRSSSFKHIGALKFVDGYQKHCATLLYNIEVCNKAQLTLSN